MIDLEARARALNERVVVEATPVETVLARARRYRLRRRLAAAAIAACVVASGIVIAASIDHAGRNAVQTVDSLPPNPSSLTIGPEAAAERLAAKIRAAAVLPPGATVYTGTPPSALSHPIQAENTPNLVDLHEVWIADESADRVVSFLSSRHVLGMAAPQCCASGSIGGTVTVRMVHFDEAQSYPPPSEIEFTQLQMSVATRTATTAWIRADAQVVWRAGRDPAERVPATDRVLTILLDSEKASAHVYTDPATVDRIERTFNGLAVAVPGPRGCTMDDTEYDLRFSVTKTSPPDVVATVECGEVDVKIDGRAAAALDAGPLVAELGTLY